MSALPELFQRKRQFFLLIIIAFIIAEELLNIRFEKSSIELQKAAVSDTTGDAQNFAAGTKVSFLLHTLLVIFVVADFAALWLK